jgi:hypothetical protein
VLVAAGDCNPQDDLCCKEFTAGGTIDAKISGTAQGQVLAQATADFTGAAASAVDDLLVACRNIALDLDVAPADRDAAESKGTPREKMKAWCDLAVKLIKPSAQVTITATFDPPKCQASVQAKASCQAKCSVDGKCDVSAHPPKCEGGKLEVSCEGKCTAEGSAPSVKCEGSCDATCQGSCTATGGIQCSGTCSGSCEATGGVQCQGKCQGTCSVATDSQGNCNGECKGTCSVTAPGASCQGTCKGSCSVTPPGVKCSGSCTGQCTGSCTATPGTAKVQCDGHCDGKIEPIKCTGGELKGGCEVDAKCDANCDASVKAKAECTPPQVRVSVTGTTNADKIIATLEANLPKVLVVAKARGAAIGNLSGTITANLSGAADIKPACIPLMAESAKSAGEDVTVSVQAATSVTSTTGG